MALSATVFKVILHIADLDRHYYRDHALTIARHPSETDVRMMVRILAFALNAADGLSFTKGLSTEHEPDLWQRNLAGDIELWIEVGQPDARRIRKACAQARKVVLYSYAGRSARVWWNQVRGKVERLPSVSVYNVPAGSSQALASLAKRSMVLECTAQDGAVWLTDGTRSVEIDLQEWKGADDRG
jgi:uncharacterized protein YaeQ